MKKMKLSENINTQLSRLAIPVDLLKQQMILLRKQSECFDLA